MRPQFYHLTEPIAKEMPMAKCILVNHHISKIVCSSGFQNMKPDRKSHAIVCPGDDGLYFHLRSPLNC